MEHTKNIDQSTHQMQMVPYAYINITHFKYKKNITISFHMRRTFLFIAQLHVFI